MLIISTNKLISLSERYEITKCKVIKENIYQHFRFPSNKTKKKKRKEEAKPPTN